MTSPGWHPDPQHPGQLRWWDGAAWTEHVATPAQGPPTHPPPSAGPPVYGPPGSVLPPDSGVRGWVIALVATAVALVLVGVPLFFLITDTPNTNGGPPSRPTSSTLPDRTGNSEPTELSEHADHAGIPVLDEEGSATHTHTLLKIVVDGEQIVIPAGIGIE